MEVGKCNEDVMSGQSGERMTTATTADFNNFRFRVISRSYIPALFEFCRCYVPVCRLRLMSYDDDEPGHIPSSDAVIEIELIGGELRHVFCSSIYRQSSVFSNARLFRNENWSSHRGQYAASADGASVQLQQPTTQRDPWTSFIGIARDCSEQNVELIIDDSTSSSLGSFDDFRCAAILRTCKVVRPGDELTIWFGEQLGRLIGVPSLSSSNIRGSGCYACSHCSKVFRHPNPLKSHMMHTCLSSSHSQSFRAKFLLPSRSDPGIQFPLSMTSSAAMRTGEHLISGSVDVEQRHTADKLRADVILQCVDSPREPEVGQSMSSGTGTASYLDEFRMWSAHRTASNQSGSSMDCSAQHEQHPPQSRHNSEDNVFPRMFDIDCSQHLGKDRLKSQRNREKSISSLRKLTRRFQNKINSSPKNVMNPCSACANQSSGRIVAKIELIRNDPQVESSESDFNFTRNAIRDVVQSQLTYAALEVCQFHHDGIASCATASPCSPSTASVEPSHQPGHRKYIESKRSSSGSQQPDNITATSCTSTSSLPTSSTSCSSPVISVSLADHRSRSPRQRLRRHRHNHQRVTSTSHECVYCGKVYSRRYGLTIHLRTHTGDKPLECPVCRRPFGDPSNLNKHVRLHAAAARDATTSPLQAHGGNINGAMAALATARQCPYRCQYCGKVLVRRRDLERHIRSRHPGPSANGGCQSVVVT